VNTDTRVTRGNIAGEIAALAASERVGLLVTALHDRRRWFGAKRGAISHHVLSHAPTPCWPVRRSGDRGNRPDIATMTTAAILHSASPNVPASSSAAASPRGNRLPMRLAAPRAIHHRQREIATVADAADTALAPCDRGTRRFFRDD
jgi:hypothetical protein